MASRSKSRQKISVSPMAQCQGCRRPCLTNAKIPWIQSELSEKTPVMDFTTTPVRNEFLKGDCLDRMPKAKARQWLVIRAAQRGAWRFKKWPMNLVPRIPIETRHEGKPSRTSFRRACTPKPVIGRTSLSAGSSRFQQMKPQPNLGVSESSQMTFFSSHSVSRKFFAMSRYTLRHSPPLSTTR
jgi:hypothetical protein